METTIEFFRLFSLNKIIISQVEIMSRDILRIVRGATGFLVDSRNSVVLEQRWWQVGVVFL